MSELVTLIDAYKDRVGGPSDASIGRAIGVARQTISAWRTRGISEPPSVDTMKRLADFLSVDYETVVLRAALIDAGWIDKPTKEDAPDSDTA